VFSSFSPGPPPSNPPTTPAISHSVSLKARLSDTLPENDLPGAWLTDTDTINVAASFLNKKKILFFDKTHVVKGWNARHFDTA
jgi:hypothetical protein